MASGAVEDIPPPTLAVNWQVAVVVQCRNERLPAERGGAGAGLRDWGAMATTEGRRRIVVIGSGTRFLSGISVHTVRLANALAGRHSVGLITMRRLIPARLYPGWKRVGADLTQLRPNPGVAHFDGVDWFWLPSLFQALWFLVRRRPQVVVFEWWTGAVVHSYIALALFARLLRARIVVEFHEVLATEEAGNRFINRFVKTFVPLFMRLADGFAVHSEHDRELAVATWHISQRRPVEIVPLGPFDHYAGHAADESPLREAPAEAFNLLFFGVIREYKGLEHLVAAFDSLAEGELGDFWLTVVGETWEGWQRPAQMIEASPRRERITFVNRYVTDAELHRYLAGADAVVLPYLRSSLSGPLHVAMGYGLPIVITDVGGNVQAAEGYAGLVVVPPADPAALADGLRAARALRGRRFPAPRSWDQTVDGYDVLFGRLGLGADRGS